MTPLDTLLKKPSVTIYLDGLMVLCYDKHQKRLQAGIHTEAHFHDITIKVRERGQSKDIESLSLEHERVREMAPFFLYVEKKEGSGTPDGTATLYKPDDPRYRQAFANVIDMQSESFHKHDHLKIRPHILAPLNILNGKFYSATLGVATRKTLECDPNPFNLGFVSTRVAGDISNTSGNLILRSNDRKAKPLIMLPLSDEKQYEVCIFNEPVDSHEPMDNHEMHVAHTHDGSCDCPPPNGEPRINHFNVYYKALVLRDGAMKYEVEIKDDLHSILQDTGITVQVLPDDPPCDIVWVSDIRQLP
jgi:hypothetical protein